MSDLKQSPLEKCHVSLKAKLVPFAGWNMPVQYTSIIDEHSSVRQGVGIFDISHMGQFFISGAGAESWLNRMFTNNLTKLSPGQGQYTLMLNESGGVIDDLIAYRTGASDFFLVVNASMIDEDFFWLAKHQPESCSLRNESSLWAGMAIQGPQAAALFSTVCPGDIMPPRKGITTLSDGSILCRTGYTGEDGFEFFCAAASGPTWWDSFTAAGAKPCGLGARDSLRLEMGFPLNGNDLSPTRTPIEAGLGFFCDLSKESFVGRETLARQKAEGPCLKLTALQASGKSAPPRAHYPVTTPTGEVIGELSSGVLSPSLMTGIGMAYLPTAYATVGSELCIDIRGRLYPFQVVKKPFYKPTPTA
jgi:aminomethyltransferase